MCQSGKHASRSLILKWLILLSLAMAGLLASAHADSLNDGIVAYKNRNYPQATQLFATAARQSPGNANAYFYLGLSSTRQQQYALARQAFERVIQMTSPQSELAAKARNNISYLTNQQIALSGNSLRAATIMRAAQAPATRENYLTHILAQGKVIRFTLAKMPLRVFISNGAPSQGWVPECNQAVRTAWRTWQSATGGKVSFTQTWTESNADIIVRWQRNFSDNILGVSPFQMLGSTLVRSDITLASYYPDNTTPISLGELVTIATHEMGHAIGLKGHSPFPEDIMYYSTSHTSSQTLSRRDINTIAMLYKLDADVQNSMGASASQTRAYLDWYQRGLQAQTSGQVATAIQAYRQAIAANGSLPEAKFNLGALLINEGGRLARQNDLQNARQCFQDATTLYEAVVQSKQAIPSAQENLAIARNNLALVGGALSP